MRSFLLFLLSLFPIAVSAQSLRFKAGGGLASCFGGAKAVGAYMVGVGYEWEFDQHWTFTPGLEFRGRGWKDPDELLFVYAPSGEQLFDEETGEPLLGVRSRSATQNYLQIPLLFSCYLRTGESRYAVLGAGPYVACGVSGKRKTRGDTARPGSDRYYYDEKTFDLPGTHRFDAGLQAFAGYEFSSGVTAGVEAAFGFVNCRAAGGRSVSGMVTLSYKLK